MIEIDKQKSESVYVVFKQTYNWYQHHYDGDIFRNKYYTPIYDDICPGNDDWDMTENINIAFSLNLLCLKNETVDEAIERSIFRIKKYYAEYEPNIIHHIEVEMFEEKIKSKVITKTKKLF